MHWPNPDSDASRDAAGGDMKHDQHLSDSTRRAFLQQLGLSGLLATSGYSSVGWLIRPRNDPRQFTVARPTEGELLTPHVGGTTPFAVILCRFNDLPELTTPKSVFEDFLKIGKGGIGDYYHDISFGALDLSGSNVFGWWTMKYGYFKDGTLRRTAWMDEARRLAKVNGLDLTPYYGVLAIVNSYPDDSASGGRHDFVLGRPPNWGQNGWSYCSKCFGLVAPVGGGVCPADGGAHSTGGSMDYRLAVADPTFPGQKGWKFCSRCACLVFTLSGNSVCAAGGKHDTAAGGDYSIAIGTAGFLSQEDWKYCKNCQMLSYAKSGAGKCPAGGNHDHSGSGNYALMVPLYYNDNFNNSVGAHEMGHAFGMQHAHCADIVPSNDKPGSDYCNPWDLMGPADANWWGSAYGRAAQGLCSGNLARLGWMPKTRIVNLYPPDLGKRKVNLVALSHKEAKGPLMARIILPDKIFMFEYRQRERWDRNVPSNAVVIHETRSLYTLSQNKWCFCSKCKALVFSGFEAGRCPAGGGHEFSGSLDYGIITKVSGFSGQTGWKWCYKCQALAFTGSGDGRCPAGGIHDYSRSLDYTMIAGATKLVGQAGWRYCDKCKGMVYSLAGTGNCSAGGVHDLSKSGEYTMMDFTTAEPLLLAALNEGGRWGNLERGISVFVDKIDPAAFTATISI